MSFCRWENNLTLDVYTKERECRVVFPEHSDSAPVLGFDGRYLAIDAGKRAHIRSLQDNRLFCLKKNFKSEMRFDQYDRLYFIEKNDIRVLNVQTMQETLLYHVGRTPHNPQNLGVSHQGTYVSFCREIGEELRLFVLDTRTKKIIDYHVTISHYAWLDDAHIVWSDGCELKLLDVGSGRNKQIVRGYKSLIKQGFDEIFAPFENVNRGLQMKLEFLRVLNGRIYFLLTVKNCNSAHEHLGLWSVSSEDFTASFHYAVPTACGASEKYLSDNEKIVWKADRWHVYDGATEETCSNDWMWVIRFCERNV